MSTTASRVIRNTSWLYLKIAVNMFITLFTTRLILEGLGAADYGIFNIVGGSITMLSFLNSTMATVTQRFINHSEGEGNKEKQKQIFNVAIIIHFSISVIVGGLLAGAGYFFFNGILNIPSDRIDAAVVVYSSLVLSVIFSVMTSPYEAIINAHENMKYFAIIGIFENILKLGAVYCCLWTSRDKLMVYGILMAFIPFISLSIMRLYCHRHYEECTIAPKRFFSLNILKDMTGFAGWNFLSASTSLIAAQGMSVVLNSFFGVLLNAAQGIATQVGGSLIIFSSNALKAINPILTKSEGAGEYNKVQYVTMFGSRIPSMILGFFSIPALFLIPDILEIWLNEVPEWAVLFTRLMVIRNLVELPFRSLGTAIYAQGQIRDFSIVDSLLNIAPLILLYIAFVFGAPPYTLYAVWIVCCLGTGINLLYFCHKKINLSISLFIKQVIIPLITISFISSLVYLIPIFYGIEMSITSKLLLSVISAAVFLLFSIKWILSNKEKEIIKNIIKKKL